MVITPDVPNLPFVIRHGIKYFELVAEPVTREILPGLFIKGWGYNGSIPDPTILIITLRLSTHLELICIILIIFLQHSK